MESVHTTIEPSLGSLKKEQDAAFWIGAFCGGLLIGLFAIFHANYPGVNYKQQALDKGLAAYTLNPKTGEVVFDWKTPCTSLTTGSGSLYFTTP